MAHEPAKSWKPSFTSQPPGFQIQWASIGYISSEMIAEYIQYAENLVLSAMAPDTMVAAVAQNTRLNTKLDQS